MITTSQIPSAAWPITAEGFPSATRFERFPLADGGVLELAVMPLPGVDSADHDATVAELVGKATAWASATTSGGASPLVVPLYGTHVVWSHRRAAVLGSVDRLPAMQAAVADFADQEAELRDIERRIVSGLDHVDDDASLAFEFDEQSLHRRRELAGRFREAVSLRRGLVVLAPAIHRPAPQPPTLAGQLGERLRDRARVVERLEHAVEQADLLERVYAGCGDRVAEFVSSRRHATLEWVIILLLVVEVVLLAVDLLATHTS